MTDPDTAQFLAWLKDRLAAAEARGYQRGAAANGCMIVASGEWVAREATPVEALSAWQSKAAGLEVENAKLRAEVKRLRGEVEPSGDEARAKIEQLRSENERLRTDLAAAEEALRKVDAELTASAEEVEKLRAELRSEVSRSCDATDAVARLITERDRARRERNDAEEALGKTIIELDEVREVLGADDAEPTLAAARRVREDLATAYRRGQEAMRERAARCYDDRAEEHRRHAGDNGLCPSRLKAVDAARSEAARIRALPLDDDAPELFDLVAYIRRHREWSESTFGPDERTEGILAHIRKELDEISADPRDIEEWADVIILAIDGAWRSGASAEDLAEALAAKQAKNRARQWPDWREVPADNPIEHVREGSDA